MTHTVLIAGGGIGGLAAALACRLAGHEVRVFERSDAFSEVGAGVQLGPNATRVLQGWGLQVALRQRAAFPHRVVARSAANGRELGVLPLGDAFSTRYGAPYATVHRADLHAMLLEAAAAHGVRLRTGAAVAEVATPAGRVALRTVSGDAVEGDAIVVADGVWSTLRALVADDGPARATGHVAYRATIAVGDLPEALRSDDVRVWLAPRAHVVGYPVRGGEVFNLVVLAESAGADRAATWDAEARASDLLRDTGPLDPGLRRLVDAMPSWRVWPLHARPPLAGASSMAAGRIALLGDAAHPMLPYLAQGAGMAIEDAAVLAAALRDEADVPRALAHYAQARWARCARVQARATRNGTIFHARGPLRWARDATMALAGPHVMDLPWLYAWRPAGSESA